MSPMRTEDAGSPSPPPADDEETTEPALALLSELPGALLARILDRLPAGADVAAFGAACRAGRALVAGQAWSSVHTLGIHAWSPRAEGPLRWAAELYPELRELDLEGAPAWRPGQLGAFSALTSLTRLSLCGASRFRDGDALAAVLRSSRGLAALDLGGTALPADRALFGRLLPLCHASLAELSLAGTPRAELGNGRGAELVFVADLLASAPRLRRLDLSGCHWLRGGYTAVDAAAEDGGGAAEGASPGASRGPLSLEWLSLAGCARLESLFWLGPSLERCPRLRHVDVSRSGLSGGAAGACGYYAGVFLDWQRAPIFLDLSGCDTKAIDLAAIGAAIPARWPRCGTVRLRGLSMVPPDQLQAFLASLAGRPCACAPNGAASSSGAEGAAGLPEPNEEEEEAAAEEEEEEEARLLSLDLTDTGRLTDAALLELTQPWASGREAAPAALGDGAAGSRKCGMPAEAGRAGDGGRSGWDQPRLRLRELRLAGCGLVTPAALAELAAAPRLLGQLRLLDLRHCEGLRQASPAAPAALRALLSACGPALRQLFLDGASLGAGLLGQLAEACPFLEELSVVGCWGITTPDLQACARLPQLRALAVGGAALSWHEPASLAAATGLTRLHIARRPFLNDEGLAPILSANTGLRSLSLAGCPGVTDGALRALPPCLSRLHLACCDRIRGGSLGALRALRSLALPGCPAVEEAALQSAVVRLTRLTALELPPHISPSRLPVAPQGAPSHLHCLRVTGGGHGADHRPRPGLKSS